MDTTALDVAFSRFGADVSDRPRAQWATAQDGSLVLVCLASRFSRPAAGVLRYSGVLVRGSARGSKTDGLRENLNAAHAAGTPVRLIIQTPRAAGMAGRVHMRPDLVGSVAGVEGDAFSVDFVRVQAPREPAPPRRKR